MNNSKQNVPYSLFVAAPDFLIKCKQESDNDVRHLGRDLWFEYLCPNCGTRFVHLTPDYPYVGANNVWTCDSCYAVMNLCDPEPCAGIPKKCTNTHIR